MIVSFPGVRPPAAVHLAFFGGTMAAAVTQADLDRLREDLRTDTQADLDRLREDLRTDIRTAISGTMAAAVTQADLAQHLDRLREDLRTDIRTALSPRLGGVLRSLFL